VHANGVNKMTLTCRTDSSSPPSSITWYIDGLHVITSRNATLTDGDYGGQVTSQRLDFLPSREMDGRIVECRASNEISSDTAASSLVSLDLRCKHFVSRNNSKLYLTLYITYFSGCVTCFVECSCEIIDIIHSLKICV